MASQVFIKDVNPHFRFWGSKINGVLYIEGLFYPSVVTLVLMIVAFLSKNRSAYVLAALSYSTLIAIHGWEARVFDPSVAFLNYCRNDYWDHRCGRSAKMTDTLTALGITVPAIVGSYFALIKYQDTKAAKDKAEEISRYRVLESRVAKLERSLRKAVPHFEAGLVIAASRNEQDIVDHLRKGLDELRGD